MSDITFEALHEANMEDAEYAAAFARLRPVLEETEDWRDRENWTRFLPEHERRTFMSDFAIVVRSRQAEDVLYLLGGWRATALVYLQPGLAEELKRPFVSKTTSVKFFVRCKSNEGYEGSLEVGSYYEVSAVDDLAEKENLSIRDGTGRECVYPTTFFEEM